jgi:hypothetical protein
VRWCAEVAKEPNQFKGRQCDDAIAYVVVINIDIKSEISHDAIKGPIEERNQKKKKKKIDFFFFSSIFLAAQRANTKQLEKHTKII